MSELEALRALEAYVREHGFNTDWELRFEELDTLLDRIQAARAETEQP